MLAVVSAVLVVAGGLAAVTLVRGGDGAGVASGGPMQSGQARDSGFAEMVDDGFVFTDASNLIRVDGDEPVVVTGVRSVGSGEQLEQLGWRVAAPGRKNARYYGPIPQWPPRRAWMTERMLPAGNATVEPVDADTDFDQGYLLMVGYRVRDVTEPILRTGVVVEYRIGDRRYETNLGGTMVLCEKGGSRNESQCLDYAYRRVAGGD